jgi:glycosyltransferase involved in cell wall biosynthesis
MGQSASQHAVLIDDGGNGRALEALAARYGNRLEIVDGPRQGAAAARNLGLRLATEEWVAFLDADDFWYPGHISNVQVALARHRNAAACFAGALHFAEDGTLINRCIPAVKLVTVADLLCRRVRPTTSATAVDAAAVLDLGGFYEGFRRPAGLEDVDLWWRIANKHACVTAPTPTVHYVVWDARNQSRRLHELVDLDADLNLFLQRVRDEVPVNLYRRAAAEHRAMISRYWYLSGFRRHGLREALAAIACLPLPSSIAALIFGLVPSPMQRLIREVRRALIRRRPASAAK